MDIKEFLDQDEIKDLIRENNLEAVYDKLTHKAKDRGEFSTYLLERDINPLDHFIGLIPDYAFYGCHSLTHVNIPNNLITISEGAFQGCDNLTDIDIPNNVTAIDEAAFFNCLRLKNVTIPDNVTEISDFAFGWCLSLTNITIPDGATNIGKSAFHTCSSLTSITIPNTVITIGKSAFEHCYCLKDIYFKGSQGQWEQIQIGDNNSQLLDATIHFAK